MDFKLCGSMISMDPATSTSQGPRQPCLFHASLRRVCHLSIKKFPLEMLPLHIIRGLVMVLPNLEDGD